MRGPAQTSEPIIQYLYQLIDSIAEGRLLIPRFQRPLVWGWDRQSELLRSVKDGIPMGAVMIWRTSKPTIECQRKLAGHDLPPPDPELPRAYLLDGLQRLSTLFAALRGIRSDMGEDAEPASIGYDLEEQSFVMISNQQSKPAVIPLSVLPNSVTLLRYQRRLKGPNAETWIDRSDELAKAFREYKVPVIPIVSDDFDVAARTFNLINSQGVKMGEADMIHALTWSPAFELRDRLEALRSEILQPLGWGQVDFETVLKVVKADADLDLYEESAEEVSKVLKHSPEAIERACQKLARVADLLRQECGILDWELVPYELQAVLLASSLSTEPSDVLRKLLADWFWLTTYGELFAGLSGYRLGVVVKAVRTLVKSCGIVWSGPSPFRIRPLPATSDFRAVRIKALALQLARRQALVFASETVPFRLLADHRRSALYQLVPRRLLAKENFSSPANRFLCAPDDAAPLRAQVLTGHVSDSVAAAHLIPQAASEAAAANDWDLFIEVRLEAIQVAEKTFVDEIIARNPGVLSRSAIGDGPLFG